MCRAVTSGETGTYEPKHLKPRGPQHLRPNPPTRAAAPQRRIALRVVQGLAVGALAGTVMAPGISGAATVPIHRGDTLQRVAKENGVSVTELARINGIADPNLIRAGATLILPSTKQAARNVAAEPPQKKAAKAPVAARRATTGPAVTVTGSRPVAPKTVASKPVPPAVVLRPQLPAEKRARMTPIFRAAARRQGVPADLLMTMCYRESDWTQKAVSSVGAKGVCQIMPDTARQLSAARSLKGRNNYEKEADNIEMGAAYLRHLMDSHPNTYTALVAYNQGPTRTNKGEILPEAAAYAKTIQQSRKHFGRL